MLNILFYAVLIAGVWAKMRLELPLVLLATANATRIVQSNDDGWAVKNIRVLNEALVAAGNDVVLSAPADNESGRGMSKLYIPFPLSILITIRF